MAKSAIQVAAIMALKIFSKLNNVQLAFSFLHPICIELDYPICVGYILSKLLYLNCLHILIR